MTFPAKAALLVALSLGTAVPFAAPALAQKPAPVAFKVNEDVRKAQAEVIKIFQQAAAGKGDKVQLLTSAEAPVAAAEAAAKTNDELYVAQELRYRKESSLNAARYAGNPAAASQETIRFAPYLDRLLANPSTPAASIGEYAYERGHIAYIAQKYQDAIPLFERSKAAGNTDIMIDAFIVDSKIKLRDFAGAAAGAEPLIARMKAAGQTVPSNFYLVGIEQAYRAKNLPAAVKWEIEWNKDYPDPKNWHDSLRRMMNVNVALDTRQRLDVWRLMRASDAIADEKERRFYGQDALDVGASREAAVVLAGANTADPDVAKLLASAKTRSAAADPTPVAAKARTASDAASAQTAGNLAYADGKYPLAVEMYKLAMTRGPADKDATLISLGAAQAQSGDKAGAQASFQAVTGSPRKEIAAYWLAYLAR